jgi:hypothetical protein
VKLYSERFWIIGAISMAAESEKGIPSFLLISFYGLCEFRI